MLLACFGCSCPVEHITHSPGGAYGPRLRCPATLYIWAKVCENLNFFSLHLEWVSTSCLSLLQTDTRLLHTPLQPVNQLNCLLNLAVSWNVQFGNVFSFMNQIDNHKDINNKHYILISFREFDRNMMSSKLPPTSHLCSTEGMFHAFHVHSPL